MSGDEKRDDALPSAPALVLDSTIASSQFTRLRHNSRLLVIRPQSAASSKWSSYFPLRDGEFARFAPIRL